MLSLVLPTYNEAENLPGLLEEIEGALGDIPFEVIVVDDDSPDGTWEIAEILQQTRPYLRVVRRRGERDLSCAVVEGFGCAHGTVLAVMDADGQHDARVLSRLYLAVRSGATIAIGSRYVAGGGVGNFAPSRMFLSTLATLLSRGAGVRVRDPMSGFFAINRSTFSSIRGRLRPRGFKILLEVLSQLPRESRVEEIPIHFGTRCHGMSKLSWMVQMKFLTQCLSLYWRRCTQGIYEHLKTFGWSVLMIIFLLIFLVLLREVWALRLLYLDANIRGEVRSSLENIAVEKGWLVSDIDLRKVTLEGMQFIHRQHVRGRDPRRCYTFSFSEDLRTESLLRPCSSL